MTRRNWAKLAVTGLLALSLSACWGGEKAERFEDKTYAISVNGYLWRAALDTLSFMPMAQVDGSAGAILTEWYVNPDVPTERLKVAVYVLDRRLSADAISVRAFREVAQANSWVSAPIREGTAQKIEEAILARARELRLATIEDD